MSHEKWYRVYGKCLTIVLPDNSEMTKVVHLLERGLGFISYSGNYASVNIDGCLCQIDIPKTLKLFNFQYHQVGNKYIIIGG